MTRSLPCNTLEADAKEHQKIRTSWVSRSFWNPCAYSWPNKLWDTIYIYMCVYNKLDPYLVVWHICVFVGEGSEMPTEPKVWVLGKWGFNTDRVKVPKDQVHYETWGLPKSRGCPNSWMVYNGKSENYMDDKWGTFFFETSIWLLVRCGRRSSISTSEQFKTWLCLK